jgi:transcriptional regulator with XRE-family HTH domain
MRRLMLDLSQTDLARAVGLTFQQVQKYEKGTNRVSASRLQQFSKILEVPIPFFFEGIPAPKNGSKHATDTPSPAYVSDFLASSDGLSLIKSYTRINDLGLRRAVVNIVKTLAGEDQ